jgi:class 3 adenylate cyclase
VTEAEPGASAPRVRVSLRAKLALLTAILAVVPLAGVGLALVDVNASAVEVSSRELQIAVLEDVARTIESDLAVAQDGLEGVGGALTSQDHADADRLMLAMTLVESNTTLDHVTIYDERGALIDTIRETEAPRTDAPPQLGDATIGAALESGVATEPPEAAVDGTRVRLTVPLRASDRVTGFASAAVSLAPVRARVHMLADSHFSGLGNALFVVDDQLRTIAHAKPEPPALVSLANEGLLHGLEPGQLDNRFSRSGEYVAADGTPVVGTVNRLPLRSWLVAAQVPRSYAYASLETMRTIVLFTVFGAIGLALIGGLVAARRIISPLRALTEFAARLGARNFGETIRVDTGDELSVLAHSLSGASTELEASEDRIRREIEIRRDLGRYIPAEIVEKVVAREQDMNLGGERRDITVLFADVVGFTPLTERLDPEQVVQVLNELFTIATEIIFRHGGTVDKFMGDCVMAIWGAPEAQADHADRAISAAEEILSWLEIGNEHWHESLGITVQLAIGVNTGPAVVGNVGSEVRMEYTAIGDVVNVAARLEAIARPQQILVTRATKDAAGDLHTYVEIGSRPVSGRTDPLELYEVRS